MVVLGGTILDTTTSILAPILPHLAEEIHQHLARDQNLHPKSKSFFEKGGKPPDLEWEDYAAAKDMSYLLKIRKAVLGLLEEARGHKRVKSSLEAGVDILLPKKGGNYPVVELLKREEQILKTKTLFITPDACLFDEGSLGSGSQSSAWVYTESLDLGEDFGFMES
ncbi:hypothetical protein F5877DRAFT_85463 [Lentinula edodes]|nr:hypothetical protein F5877DRAFT_85463 [Lentinula edodes]